MYLLLAGAAACAHGSEPLGPPPEYVREGSSWAPEELNRDLLACLDRAHESAMLAYGRRGARDEILWHALRDGTTNCMSERGWALR